MKNRILTLGMLMLIMSAKAQKKLLSDTTKADTTSYKSRKIKLEEVKFATSYYSQEGNNSAVTGGIGTEELTDAAATINLNFSRYSKRNNKQNLNVELGVDVYTSASSDKIDPSTVSSASANDQRTYGSVNYKSQHIAKGYTIGGGLSMSSEFDYNSVGANLSFSKLSKDKSREISVTTSAFFDTWRVIYPIELRPPGYGDGSTTDGLSVITKPRNSYNLGLVFSQVVNREFQFALMGDVGYQDGLLGTTFQRVYFNDGSAAAESLPSTRFKIPLGVRASYFLGDKIVLRGFYRYYRDNWELSSHTASLELAYKITPFISLSPSYRFYTQTGTEYFAKYQEHAVGTEFYTSDYDLSKFNSSMIGLNARFSNLNGKLGIKSFNTAEIRYGYYERNTGLSSHIVSLVFTFKNKEPD
jgi:Protein of unknown function (DUF3570)